MTSAPQRKVRARGPLRSGGRDDLGKSRFGGFREGAHRQTNVRRRCGFQPTGNVQNFTVIERKFTPSTFGDTVSSIYGAGNITTSDSRISVVPSFWVPAGGSYNLTVTINPGHSTGVVQGWIRLDGPNSNDLHFAYYGLIGP